MIANAEINNDDDETIDGGSARSVSNIDNNDNVGECLGNFVVDKLAEGSVTKLPDPIPFTSANVIVESPRCKMSQTLVFSSKDSRNRFRQNSGSQTATMMIRNSNSQPIILAEKKINQQGSVNNNGLNFGGLGNVRNTRTQVIKRSTMDQPPYHHQLHQNDSTSKEYSSYFYNTNKFSSNEWLNLTSLSGKHLDVSATTTSVVAALQINLPEDMRISKLLRRLCAEKNPINALGLCDKLKLVIVDPNNSLYIRRSFDILADSLISVLKDGPSECVNDVSKIFGMMGYVVRNDFFLYKSWLSKSYKMISLRIPMMISLLQTLKMDRVTRDLKEQAPKLMEMLKDYLENAEVARLFLAITNVIRQCSFNYPKAFAVYFTDIVDIVVGWHLETDQPATLKLHCSELLQSFTPFWTIDVEFTNNLLGQFLEDIVVCGEEIRVNKDRLSPILDKTAPPELCFASLVGAYNSVLKCSWERRDEFIDAIGSDFLTDSFDKITTFAIVSFQSAGAIDIVTPVNELIVIILNGYQFGVEIDFDNLFQLIHLEIEEIDSFTDGQILSFLFAIHKILTELKTTVPFEFISDIFGQQSKLLKLKFVKNKSIYGALVKIYQEVLNIKNVSLLQEAYKQILFDLGIAMKALSTEDFHWCVDISDNIGISNKYTKSQAECTVSFYLTSISSLATSNSSIIAMWALQPNILELLTKELQAINFKIWANNRAVHYAIIYLIASHCRNNHNFISSSSLINRESTKVSDVFNMLSQESTTSSPTSQHYAIILNFLQNLFQLDLGPQTIDLCLDWCQQLIQQSAPYSLILKTENAFTNIIKCIALISIQSHHSMVIKCADCFDALYEFDQVNIDILTCIAEVCCIHMCANEHIIRDRFSRIFAKLPLNIALKQVNHYTGLAKERARLVSEYQNWHKSQITYGDMRPQYFKEFIDVVSVSNRAEHIEIFCKNIFVNCWYQEHGAAGEFYKMVMKDVRCLVAWSQWEAAQYCVNNKLRTSLGKPQETFLKIESIIKEDARILALKEKTNADNVEALISNQKHARVLLGFMENLEKAIYNASHGTAFALPVTEKPAKTFFHINAPTCNEWFNRIRTAVDLVALHCMESEMVIRYCEVVLKGLAAIGKTNEPLFEHTLMSYAWALLRNGESDALYGVYVWTKTITNRKFVWVKLAAEQAAGHREVAIIGYKTILESPDESKLDRHVRDFIADQLTYCYLYLQRWNDMYDFIRHEENRTTPRVTIPLLSVTSAQLSNTIEFLKSFDKTVLDMGDWETLDAAPSVVSSDFSCHKLHSLAENTIWKAGFSSVYDDEPLRLGFAIVQNGLQECLRTDSREHLNNLIVLNHIYQKIIESKCDMKKINLHSILVDKTFGSMIMMRLLCWSEFIMPISTGVDEQINIDLRLNVCSTARKEGNLLLCKSELEVFFNKSGFAKQLSLTEPYTIEELCSKLIDPAIAMDIDLWNPNTARGVYEAAKWLYCYPDSKEHAIQLAASTAIGICLKISSNNNGGADAANFSQRAARTLLTLSEWIQGENEKLLTEDKNMPLNQLVLSLPDIKLNHEIPSVSCIPIVDASVGKIIQYSTNQCPNLAKAWGALGNWCYRWGRKMVELRIEHNDKGGLRTNDIEAISQIIPNASVEDVAEIVAILNRQSPEDEDISASEACSTEQIELQLRSFTLIQNSPQSQLHEIIEIWRQAQKSIYSYYELSADAYFKYLQLATTYDDSLENDKNRNCSIVTATLRLLRLVVKHALGLQDVLDEGLARTPTSPWKVIIPQLFSRLNHHEPYVRRRVSELLCRVAQDAPHLIIFPAVVGTDQERSMDITDISLASEDLDVDDDDRNISHTSKLKSCFNSLLDTLSKQARETVEQVQVLVRELKRITLLWDELWLVALMQVYSECSRRLINFEMELQKRNKDASEKNGFLIEKHRILMRPILFVMERLYAITSEKPETTNEHNFQERYKHIIEDTIVALKKPMDRANPNEAWQKFKLFYGMLQQRAQKRSSCLLKMTDISPVLAKMRNTAISMPGVEHGDTNFTELVYIKSVDNIVHILPTKTKPKKLAFYGSNGKRFTYLFKGLEDLHLDERIMQFLSISNSMMTRSTDCNGNISNYRARHYSVIPLGPRSGLISWVDGLTPIFALYKKWQQREAANPKKEKNSISTRPSELFVAKLTPLLAEHNLKITDHRKDWPLSVLKQVLSELSRETPRDLLAKELWCYSINAAQWRQVIRMYSQSIAVMSVIGYVIGLGDRHLDNILIELSSGEVVHIDYNVCFEKGKTLRVPEKVPFRMTPNLEEALGVTGIEGTFRLACEYVLKALKKGRETLLTLLEAFVYDPLVDWAVGGEDGAGGALTVSAAAYGGEALGGELRQAKRQFEQEVTRETLAIRFTDIKVEWMQNRDQIYQQLIDMRDHLQLLQKQRAEFQQLESKRDMLSKQLAMVREADTLGTAMGSHPLNSLSQRYNVYKQTKSEFDLNEQAIHNKLEESRQHVESHRCLLDIMREDKMTVLLNEIDELLSNSSNLSEFALVKNFLENSAQGATFIQSEQTRKELDSSLLQQMTVMKRLVEYLIQYGSVVMFHPRGYIDQHRETKYVDWCNMLLDDESAHICRDIVLQYHAWQKSIDNVSVQPIISFAYQLQTIITDNNFKLQRTFDRLKVEIDQSDDQHLLKFDRTYEDAKYAVDIFLQDENGAIKALECVTLTAICDLNKRLLMIENAATSAGDNLLDLTLNGKWFLDELVVITTISNELTNVACKQQSITIEPDFIRAMECFRASSAVYQCLRKMYHTFIDSILSDIMYGIASEEPSILEMISNVSNLQQGLQSPIPELLKNLHIHLRFSALNMPSPHKAASIDASTLRQNIHAIKVKFQNGGSVEMGQLSLGQKVFLSLDKLFVNLEECQRKLTQKMADLKYPDEWQKIDQIKESRDLATLIFNPTTRSIFEDIFVVRRLEMMIEMFTMCLQVACAFKGNGVVGTPICDDEVLARPLKKFISDYCWRLQLGVSSHAMSLLLCGLLQKLDLNIKSEIDIVDVGALSNVSLEDLCRKGVDRAIKRGDFSSIALNHATTLCVNLDVAWRKKELIEYLQNAVRSQSESIKRTRLLLTAHLWMFEGIVTKHSGFPVVQPINRIGLLMQIGSDVKTLTAWRASLLKMRDEIGTFVQAITQRLKWAVGANPGLQELLASFSNMVNLKRTEFDQIYELSETVLNHCNAVLHYESVRYNDSTETNDHDKNMLELIGKRENICAMMKNCTAVITPIEKALVQLLDPEGPIDHIWLTNVAGLIDDMIDQMQTDINQVEKLIVSSQDNLQNYAHKLRTLMGKHHRMGSEIRSLLRSSLKIEGSHSTPIREYLKCYKDFLDRISELHGNVLSKDFTEQVVTGTLNHLSNVLGKFKGIFNDLFLFEHEFKDTSSSVAIASTISLNTSPNGYDRQAEPPPPSGSPTLKKTKKGTEQKRNAYAVSVWRRIRMKLEGRDPDPTRRCTAQEQVDWMIREAMNPDNLAVLYEGWTPWV